MYSALKCSREVVTFVDLPDKRVHDDLPEILAEVVYLPADQGAQVQEISPDPAGIDAEVIEEVLPDWLASYQVDTQQRRAERDREEEKHKEEEIPDWLANPDSKPVVEEEIFSAAVVGEVEEPPEGPIEDPDLAEMVEDLRSQLIEEKDPEPEIETPPAKKPEEQGIVLDKPLELEDIFVPAEKKSPPVVDPEPEPLPVSDSQEPEEPYFDWPEPLEQEPYVPPWQRGADLGAPAEYQPEEKEDSEEPAAWEILPTKKPEKKEPQEGGNPRWIRWLLVSLILLVGVAVVIITGGQPIDTAAGVVDAEPTATAIPASATPVATEPAPTPIPVEVVNGCATIGGLRIRQEPTEEAGIAGGMNFEQCLPFDAISADGAWLRTQAGNEEGVVGWVALDFLIVDGNVQDLPVVE